MIDHTLSRHSTRVRVRNYEIDWQGIVHDAEYLHYFEVGRVAYLEDLGIQVDVTTIQHESRVVVARNEIDYRSPARFGELLDIQTRVSTFGETRFSFEALIEETATKRLVAENLSVHVWLDDGTHGPLAIPDRFRAAALKFEGGNCQIQPVSGIGNLPL